MKIDFYFDDYFMMLQVAGFYSDNFA